jgi:hypothetical protein
MQQIQEIQTEIDDLLWNFPKFQTKYRASKKYPGMMEIIKSPECKRYIKKIDSLRKTKFELIVLEAAN